MPLTATIKASIRGAFTSALDLATANYPIDRLASIAYEDGAGANQANQVWEDTRTLTASATENLDLAGVLTNAFGATVSFARIKAILITAAPGNTNGVQVTRPASNGFPLFMAASDGIELAAGAVFLWADPSAAGKVVTAGTGDILTVTNSAGSTSVTYSITIIGATS